MTANHFKAGRLAREQTNILPLGYSQTRITIRKIVFAFENTLI